LIEKSAANLKLVDSTLKLNAQQAQMMIIIISAPISPIAHILKRNQ